jgi:benzoate-CoA ligase
MPSPSYSTVDRSTSPPVLQIPRDYNAAVDFVDRHLDEGRGAKTAFRDDTTSLTYAELAEQVNRAGNALRALGVGMEQRVLLLLQDTVRFPVAFFGAIKIGAVPVPLNTLLTPSDYDYLFRDSRARVLVISAALYEKIAKVLEGQPFLERVIVDGEAPGSALSFGALLEAASPALAPAPTIVDDACFWLYTSGSTGQLKGAVHLHSDLVYTAEYYAVAVLGIREEDVVFSAAKLFFAYGLGNALTFPLRVGATALLMAERPTPASASNNQPCSTASPPSTPPCSPIPPGRPGARFASASPRARPSRETWGSAGRRARASISSTASARPSSCTSSSPIDRARCGMGRPARWSPATR